MGLFSIINVNTRLLILANVVEFLRQASLNVFSYYPNLKICLDFNGSQPIYTYKHYAYKSVYLLPMVNNMAVEERNKLKINAIF